MTTAAPGSLGLCGRLTARFQLGVGMGGEWRGGMDGLHRTHLSSFLPGLPCDPGTSLGVLRPPPQKGGGIGHKGVGPSLAGPGGMRANLWAISLYTVIYTAEAPGPPRDEMGLPGTPGECVGLNIAGDASLLPESRQERGGGSLWGRNVLIWGPGPMPSQLPCCRVSKVPAGQCKSTRPSSRPSAEVAPGRALGQPGVPRTTQLS